MVVPTRDELKLAFSRRLNEALDGGDECPKAHDRGRAAWVARRYKVSPQAAGKWLDGTAIPDQTNLARVAADLGVTPQWLHANQLPKHAMTFDPMITGIFDIVVALDPTERAEVLKYARYRAGLAE